MSSTPRELDEKYDRQVGRLYLNGTQALVRLLLLQKWRDTAAGLNTRGFVSGYRGSPLGGFDRELWRAQSHLDRQGIQFWPGINEDLAATAVWGTQMLGLHRDASCDGVFAMWYGKGAGLDRCGDAIRHANASGVHRRGGVLAVVGDDHAQKSSTQPYFCEPTFADLLVPVLYPSTIAELLEYGLLGWALSRFSGTWVGLKALAELLDCSSSFEERSALLQISLPEPAPPPGSVHFRWPDPWHEGEIRWIEHRLPALHAFARTNHIDRVVGSAQRPRLGIVTAGKTYCDLLQALVDLGTSLQELTSFGISVYKVGMTWPLEPSRLREFAAGIPELMIIEEKRPILEDQVRVALSVRPDPPKISGKRNEAGEWQFPWVGELNPDVISRVLTAKVPAIAALPAAQRRLAALERQKITLTAARPIMQRPPYFCSGCPHNTSTRVPERSRAIAGVGCHYMAVDMDRSTETFSHMGGEGATWIGQAPFSRSQHVFVNLGEGTYFHSGSLAIRACIAAGVNVTYKILYNDAIAMTGGQPLDGQLTVPQLAQQLRAEGIREIRIVAEEPEKFRRKADLPPDTVVCHRKNLDSVQRELRGLKGVTVLIYDQTCAAEKRRRRKRGQLVDPAKWTFINTAVCEGCGDCSIVSNCLSVVPIETELGRKRTIDQSSCNKDFSCIEGFCPSFVTVVGGRRKPPLAATPTSGSPPEPVLPAFQGAYNIFVAGVGGTGVVTVGALLGMAAHLEHKACTILDQLGMAQKGGAVVSHIRIGGSSQDLPAAHVPSASADVLLGFDLAVTLQDAAVSRIAPGRTRVILNTHETITGAFTRNPDLRQPTDEMVAAIRCAAGEVQTDAFDATLTATSLLGDSIATNLFILGYALQKGLIPLSVESLRRAVGINGVAVDFNLKALDWGRRAAIAGVPLSAGEQSSVPKLTVALPELIERRMVLLTEYQDAAYARFYREFLERVRTAELRVFGERNELSTAVALSLYKLMAYKDEYEVARLYTHGTFIEEIRRNFEGHYRLDFHLAPPIISRKDRQTGRLRKRTFGPWVYGLFRLLAACRGLRGTIWDPFAYTRERVMERRLIKNYRSVIERLLVSMTPATYMIAVQIAELPLAMRGFGHVKAANVAAALSQQEDLLARLAVAAQTTSKADLCFGGALSGSDTRE